MIWTVILLKVVEIDNKTAMEFIEKWRGKDIIPQKHDKWYAVFDDGILLNVAGVNFRKNHIVIGGVITRKDYRRRGVNKFIHSFLLAKYDGKIVCYALPENAIMLEKYFGFKTIRTYTNGTKYMIREGKNYG